ncbi:hypothetical protein [Paracoccus hibiscisoli]|uniref:hypothetical protein n=1 Tax=Paracoccus hibiscisoli TaxID=2023261 RepID=UPI0023F1C369|nr:hypothetical protein [Paracoccus hibiscisoli]
MEIGTLKELNVKQGDVVECADAGITKDHLTVGKTYNVHSGPMICTDKGRFWGEGDRAHTGFPTRATFRIVSRATPPVDLTALEKPFGLLDAATQEALRAHGGPYEMFAGSADGHRWRHGFLGEYKGLAYRVKPAPKRETVTQDGWMTEGGSFRTTPNVASIPVRVTFDRVDGQIDLPTYRVEAR